MFMPGFTQNSLNFSVIHITVSVVLPKQRALSNSNVKILLNKLRVTFVLNKQAAILLKILLYFSHCIGFPHRQ